MFQVLLSLQRYLSYGYFKLLVQVRMFQVVLSLPRCLFPLEGLHLVPCVSPSCCGVRLFRLSYLVFIFLDSFVPVLLSLVDRPASALGTFVMYFSSYIPPVCSIPLS